MSIKSNNTQYDVLLADLTYDPEKLKELRAFYKKHNAGAKLKEKAQLSLGFVKVEE